MKGLGITPWAAIRILAAVAVAAVAWQLPDRISDLRALELATVGAYFIALLGLYVLTGLTGQISLGQGAFMALGAYTSGILIIERGWPDNRTIAAAAVVCGIAGVLATGPALRLSGVYLALATFALAVCVSPLVRRFDEHTGGGDGLLLPNFPLGKDMYDLTLKIAIPAAVAVWLLTRGRLGRAMRAVRDSETAATAYGIHVGLIKAVAFGTGALLAGVAGSLLALGVAYVGPDSFPIALSILLVTGLVLGGVASPWGALIGAFFVYYLPLRTSEWATEGGAFEGLQPTLVYGLVLIAVMMLVPTGVAGVPQRLRTALTRARRARSQDLGVGPPAAAEDA